MIKYIKEWVLQVGMLKIFNSLWYLAFEKELVGGIYFQLLFPAILVVIFALIEKSNQKRKVQKAAQ